MSPTPLAHSMIMVLDSVWGLYVCFLKSNFPQQIVQDLSLYGRCRFIRTALRALLHPSTHTGIQEPRPSQKVSIVFLSTSHINLSPQTSFPRHCDVEIRPCYLHQVVRQSGYLHPQLGATEASLPHQLPETSCCTPMSHCRLCTQPEQIEFAPHLFPLAIASMGKGGKSVLTHDSANGEEKDECSLTQRKGLHLTFLNN